MNVKLVWITPEPEKQIAYIARVSNPDNQDNPNYTKLIKYLIRNKHWSPLEQSVMSVEIKTSRAIAPQILRHRSFSFQEFSQRYSEATDFEPVEIRRQATKNRQSSLEVFDPMFATGFFTYAPEDTEHKNMIPYDKSASQLIQEHIDQGKDLYTKLINAGVAKEVARMILPLTTQTTLYMTGSARSWIHYLDLRMDEHTQKEHRDVANAISEIFAANYPTVWQAYQELKTEERDARTIWNLLKSGKIVEVDTNGTVYATRTDDERRILK